MPVRTEPTARKRRTRFAAAIRTQRAEKAKPSSGDESNPARPRREPKHMQRERLSRCAKRSQLRRRSEAKQGRQSEPTTPSVGGDGEIGIRRLLDHRAGFRLGGSCRDGGSDRSGGAAEMRLRLSASVALSRARDSQRCGCVLASRSAAWAGLDLVSLVVLYHLEGIAPVRAFETIPANVPVLILAGENGRRVHLAEASAIYERVFRPPAARDDPGRGSWRPPARYSRDHDAGAS